MTTAELREAFQRFFEERGHLRVPGHSLIPPADDLSTLFIVAGMQQFKPYFLRTKEPPANRVVSVQKCLRAGGKDTDLEEVGRTDRHCSFFEMLGNFSFGDYFKDEAVDFAWEFVTKVMGFEPERLWATVHEGDPGARLDEDTVAIEAWKRVGIPVGADRAARQGQLLAGRRDRPVRPVLGDLLRPRRGARLRRPDLRPGRTATATWRSTTSSSWSTTCGPGNDLVPLPSQNVDTGLGLERSACVLQDVDSIFDTDGFRLIMDWVERRSRASPTARASVARRRIACSPTTAARSAS